MRQKKEGQRPSAPPKEDREEGTEASEFRSHVAAAALWAVRGPNSEPVKCQGECVRQMRKGMKMICPLTMKQSMPWHGPDPGGVPIPGEKNVLHNLFGVLRSRFKYDLQ